MAARMLFYAPSSTPDLCRNSVAAPDPEDRGLLADCAILLSARDTLADAASLNWSVNRPLSQWKGVTVSDSRVVKLSLINNQLTGSIPPELGNLTNLQTLSLINNQLTGSIPTSLGNLTNLQRLYLSNNQLTGPIPASLGNLTKLQRLSLRNNQLTGSIPASLGNLTNLRALYLSGNRLTGCISSSLRSLKNIGLSSLRLPDCAPDDKPTATPIAERPGPRFTVARDVVNVRQGPGTNFSIIGTVNAGMQFDISGKNPAGDWLQFCCLNGKRGWIYAPLTQVENPQLIPIATPVATDRSGPPTAALSSTPNVCRNSVAAPDPEDRGLLADCAILLSARDTLAGAASLNWNVNRPLSQWKGVIMSDSRVVQLSLTNNQLTGSIPAELGSLTNLQQLYLYKNQLTGSIPPELGNLTNLQRLYLYNNQLTGRIPPELGNLTNLQRLYLDKNQLTGRIPPELGNLTNLQRLYLYNNQLTGSIPAELGNLTNLQQLYLSKNQLTGRIPPELGNLTNLRALYLSGNRLTGSIPAELGNLTKLQRLYLYNNQLTGSIPAELGNLTKLQTLNLSGNQLTGSIPASLDSLTNLQVLHLSENRLMGDEPTATPIAERPEPRFTVARDVVNVRQGPGTNFSIIGTVNVGMQFDISGKNPAGDWLQFCCLNGKRGWIYAPLTQVENPQSIPIATPVATDRSRPPTPEQIGYIIEIAANVENLSTALIGIGSLFASPRIGDEAWIWELGFYLVFIRETYESALEISPPASLQNVHSTYIEGAALCNQATYLIVEALDNRDMEKFNNAGGLVRECSSRVTLASQMLDEAMPLQSQ